MKFSIIIPALNEEKNIVKCLGSITNQEYPRKNYEIIVVDGNSNDNTVKVAKKYAKVIIEKRRGIGLARNRGAKIAKGEVLIFIDADTKVYGKLFEEMEKAFSDSSIVGATAKTVPDKKTVRFMFIIYLFNVMTRLSMRLGHTLSFTFCTACRKGAFKKIKGFNENLYSVEDMEFSFRLSKYGKYKFLGNVYAVTSMRRLENWGLVYSVYRYFHGSGLLFGKKKVYYRVD